MSQEVIDELKIALTPEGSYEETWYTDYEVGNFRAVDIIDHGDRRWSRGETVIVEHIPSGDYYAFRQDVGLTEYQEGTVYRDEVWPVKKQIEMVEVVKWVKE